ncbi:MAG TPA: superoxide dismutase family protein [Balneolaceae bacterium]
MIGCTEEATVQEQLQNEVEQNTTDYTKAVAIIYPTEESNVSGIATFEKVAEGVRVHAELEGLTEGPHGFHVHQYGDCTAPDLSSAGGHYNPNENPHAAPTDSLRHMGDMGNIEVDAEGNATIDYVDSHIQLNGPNSIIGRAVIVHQGQDDLTSQPSGAAGARIGCGVIGIANTESQSSM